MTAGPHLTADLAATTARCPICRAAAVYVRPPDRFFHLDGSDNQPCWRAILARPLDAPDGLDAESAARIAAMAASPARRRPICPTVPADSTPDTDTEATR